mgnify:CR=1 FL=1
MSLENIRFIAGNENHSLAINGVGQVFTWGSTANGKLGHGEYNPRANVTGREPRPKYATATADMLHSFKMILTHYRNQSIDEWLNE